LNATGVTLTMDTNSPPDGTCNGALALPNTPRGGSGLTASVASFQYTGLGSTNQSAPVAITIANSTGITVDATTGYVHD